MNKNKMCSHRGCKKAAVGYHALPWRGLLVCEDHAPRKGVPFNEKRGDHFERYRLLGQKIADIPLVDLTPPSRPPPEGYVWKVPEVPEGERSCVDGSCKHYSSSTVNAAPYGSGENWPMNEMDCNNEDESGEWEEGEGDCPGFEPAPLLYCEKCGHEVCPEEAWCRDCNPAEVAEMGVS